jgi:hypothetical protein
MSFLRWRRHVRNGRHPSITVLKTFGLPTKTVSYNSVQGSTLPGFHPADPLTASPIVFSEYNIPSPLIELSGLKLFQRGRNGRRCQSTARQKTGSGDADAPTLSITE